MRERTATRRCSRAPPPAHRIEESPTGDPVAGYAPAESTSISLLTASRKKPVGRDNRFSANGNLPRYSSSQHGGPYQDVPRSIVHFNDADRNPSPAARGLLRVGLIQTPLPRQPTSATLRRGRLRETLPKDNVRATRCRTVRNPTPTGVVPRRLTAP